MSTESELKSLINYVEDLEQRISAIEGKIVKSRPKANKKMSIVEFNQALKPNSGNQIALAVCYFVEVIDGITPFNLKDLGKVYSKGKLKKSKNLSDNIYQNIKKGLIREVEELKDNLKAWELTQSGIQYVEDKLLKSD